MYFKHNIYQVLYRFNAYSLRFPATLRISYIQRSWVCEKKIQPGWTTKRHYFPTGYHPPDTARSELDNYSWGCVYNLPQIVRDVNWTCLNEVWKVSGTCQEDVKVSCRHLEGVWIVSGRFLEGVQSTEPVWKVAWSV